ncbi:uncharacterized protein METZ01_LOCUS475763, partial [marine metagenome]
MLKAADDLWGKVLWGLMGVAAVYVALIMIAIVYVSAFRFFGLPYNPYTFPFIEYGFIFVLFLGSPWLIRNRGHVYIELLTAALSARHRKILSRIICLIAGLVCAVWAWYTWFLFLERFEDIMAFDELRAQFDIPLWISTVPFPVGFFLMAIEFLRFVFVSHPMHTGLAG